MNSPEARVTAPGADPEEHEEVPYEEAFKEVLDPSTKVVTPGPPIFNPEEQTPVPPMTPDLLPEGIRAAPICLRCMEVVAKCECAEGPEEG